MYTPENNHLDNVKKLFKEYEGVSTEIQAAVVDTEGTASVARLFAPSAEADLRDDDLWKILPHYEITLKKKAGSLIILLSNKEERDRFISIIQDVRDEKKEENKGIAPFAEPKGQSDNSITITGDEAQINNCIAVIKRYKQHEITLEAGFAETSGTRAFTSILAEDASERDATADKTN